MRCPLQLEDCYLDSPDPHVFDYATALRIVLSRCRVVGGVTADLLVVTKELDLGGSAFEGPVRLAGADITGQLSCRAAQLTGTDADGDALAGEGLKVAGDVFLDQGFTAAGAVLLGGADITGQLFFSGAHLTGTDADGTGGEGTALYGDGLKVGGGVFLDQGFTAAGTVRLGGADITGQLICRGAQLTGTDGDGNALDGVRMKVGSDVFLDQGFTAAGAIRLAGARITGQLFFSGAHLTGTDGDGTGGDGTALYGDWMKVGGVVMDQGFTAAGAVRLLHADIAGQLICRDAHLTGTDGHGNALVGDWMKVGGVFLDERFTAAGAVRLAGADITGQLSLRSAQLTGADSDGNAVNGDEMKVGGGVFLDEGFTAAGAVRLGYADITGQLSLRSAQLTGTDSHGNALVGVLMKVGSNFSLDQVTAAGAVRLLDADITGPLLCPGAQLTGTDRDGNALHGERIKVGGGVFLNKGFTAAGVVRLGGANITGELTCRGGQLTGTDSDGNALYCARMKIGGSVFLDEGFTAAGAIELAGADITGQLSCRGAHLTGIDGDGDALNGDRLKVGSGVFLDQGFTAGGAVRLGGADITGQLSFSGAHLIGIDGDGDALIGDGLRVGGSVFLDQGFTAAGAIRLGSADITGQLSFRGAQLTGTDSDGNAVNGDRMKVGGGLYLDQVTASGTVRLGAADITGQLICRGAQLTGTDGDGTALLGDGLKVNGGVFLNQGFTAAGAIRLAGADITGELTCRGAQLTGTDGDGDALIGDGLRVGGDLFLDSGFMAAGTVRLGGADITGQLSFRGAHLTGTDSDGTALLGDGLKVRGDMFLIQGFTAAGTIRLADADITGQLSFRGAQLTATDSDGNALNGDRMKVGGGLILDQVTASGTVRLGGADITGQLSFSDAQLTGTDGDGDALNGDRLKVGSGVFLDQGFTAAGAIRLAGADITGELTCRGAQLTGTDGNGNALLGNGLKVGGDLFLDQELDQGFTAAGAVSLIAARIGGSVWLDGAELAEPVALRALGIHVGGQLHWAPRSPVRGLVDLERAAVHRLDDDWNLPDAHWPPAGQLHLVGFAYDGFGGQQQALWQQRLEWIRRSHTTATGATPAVFAAQPYEQLARVYRQAGQETEARNVAIARRSDLRRYGSLTRSQKLGNWLADKTIRHGYQPLRAVGLLVAVYVVVLLVFWGAQHHDSVIVPAKDTQTITPAPTALHCSSTYPCFYPAGYAVDVVVPIINLGQAENWRPNGDGPWGWAYLAVAWVATGLGWAFTTLAVVGYTGLVRKD